MLQYQCEYNTSDNCYEKNEEEKKRMKQARLEESGKGIEVGGEVNLEGGAKAAEDTANEISESLNTWVSTNNLTKL